MQSDHLDIIQDNIPSQTLLSKLKEIGRDERQVARYTWEILCGLEFLHYNDVIHGNLTNENVLVKANGTCCLTNFGRVEEMYLKAHAKVLVYQDLWTPPELIKSVNRTKTSRGIDIWSLGCIVIELMNAESFWSVETQMSSKSVQTKSSPDYPRAISEELKDFLDCCLQNIPTQRANVFELIRHPFVQQMKLKQPLSHLHSRLSVQKQSPANLSAKSILVEAESPKLSPAASLDMSICVRLSTDNEIYVSTNIDSTHPF